MASGLVDAVVEKLGGMLIEEINKEISLFCNFRNDFEWLKKKLTSIRSYLRDADAQSAHSEPVRSWLLDVAELAWDAEDIVDECALQFKGTDTEIPQSSCVACVNFNYSQIAFRYKMARRLRDVKERMRSIMADAAELKLVGDLIHRDQLPSASTSGGNVKWRGASLIQSGSRPVAIDSKVQEVVHLLDDTAASSIIAVVGMGGAGKTFLMQNVFSRVKDKFEKSAWLTVSQTYSLRRLQADLASEIKDLNEVVDGKVSEVQAAKLIHDKLLKSKSCLVVLDDVWRATGEDDLIYALGLPMGNINNRTQCKVVVTTRSRFVCRDLDARVYEMQLCQRKRVGSSFVLMRSLTAFLDISRCSSLKELPNWIGELDCLQHLDLSGFEGSIPNGISKVVSLRVLRSFVFRPSLPGYDGYKLSAEDDGFLKLEHLVNLLNLREVHIHIDHDAQLKSIEDGILASLVKMRILTLRKSVRYGDSRPPLSEGTA